MRLILMSLLLVFASAVAFAQTDGKTLSITAPAFTPVNSIKNKDTAMRICTCSTGSSIASPLIVIFSHDKIIYKSTGSSDMLSKISPQAIKSINVLKGSSTLVKYGDLAKDGVIEIYLDDKNYPDAYKLLKSDSTEE